MREVKEADCSLTSNGVRLHALAFGAGPRTVVAVGGWTGSWEVWEEPIAQLTARGWRCVTYDHRGSGESPVDPALIRASSRPRQRPAAGHEG
jgi:pimeloyl-ACP methyl ester carboxylesterase